MMMINTLFRVVFTALLLPSTISALPASSDTTTILQPITNLDSVDLSHREWTKKRADSTAAPLVLSPISASKAAALAAGGALDGLSSLRKRDVSASAPLSVDVSIFYASVASTAVIAEINATMAQPSVLLEDISAITAVDCSANSVAITFDTAASLADAMSSWGPGNFILFTNHLGDCDAENERGLYLVDTLASNDLVLTASTTKTDFNSSTSEMTLGWTKPVAVTATTKRDVTGTFSVGIPEASVTLSGTTNDVTPSLTIDVIEASLSGAFAMSGHATYSWSKFKFTDFYIDLDMSVDSILEVDVTAKTAYDNDVYTYSPASLTVSAFSIPGVLDVGPILTFALGVEAYVSGAVEVSAELKSSIADGNVHLDLVDSSLTTSSGWTPAYTGNTNISLALEAQLNPYATVTAEIGVNFLSGLLDLSAGVTAKPIILNVFDVQAEFDDITNIAGVTIPPLKPLV